MGLIIEDGTGTGIQVGVTSENQLRTEAETHELQHHISRTKGQVYQCIGEVLSVGSGINTLLHIKNDSTSLSAVVSYFRLQTPGLSGGNVLPDKNTYFQVGRDSTYTSGGTTVVPVNMNFTSGNEATLAVHNNDPVIGGTFTEFDRYYADASSMEIFNKHGSLIMGLNDTLEVRLVTDHTAGFVYCRVTVMMMDLSA